MHMQECVWTRHGGETVREREREKWASFSGAENKETRREEEQKVDKMLCSARSRNGTCEKGKKCVNAHASFSGSVSPLFKLCHVDGRIR